MFVNKVNTVGAPRSEQLQRAISIYLRHTAISIHLCHTASDLRLIARLGVSCEPIV